MRRWLETVARSHLVVGTLGVVVALGAAGWVVEAELLWAASLASAGLGGGAVGWRLWSDALPLRLGRAAVRLEINGHPAFQVRAMLGRGRALRGPVATAVWVPAEGAARPLRVVGPGVAALVGPWTVLVIDDEGVAIGAGALQVEVGGSEAGRSWKASARWTGEQIFEGRLVSVVQRRGGRVGWDATGWEGA